jgi:hypothetical protein
MKGITAWPRSNPPEAGVEIDESGLIQPDQLAPAPPDTGKKRLNDKKQWADPLAEWDESASTASPNNTVNAAVLTPDSALSTNADAVIKPKGNGALIAHIPDSVAAGGNKRGAYAVDWQLVRSVAANVASGQSSVIGGGEENKASSAWSTVSGGKTNYATDLYATIGGGEQNAASQDWTTISGGKQNLASDQYATVGGGLSNSASGARSTIAGGDDNDATGQHSAVGGGFLNDADGTASTVPGGYGNDANGQGSTILGTYYAKTDLFCQVAQAGGRFGAAGDAQQSTLTARIQTTNGTANVEMFLDGVTERLVLPNDTTWMFTVRIVARRTDVDGESAAYQIQGCIDRNGSAATTALVGSPTKAVVAEDTAAWDCQVTADTTNGSLKIDVTGEASKTIRWVASIHLVHVTG